MQRTRGRSAHMQTHAADLEELLQPHQPQVPTQTITHNPGFMEWFLLFVFFSLASSWTNLIFSVFVCVWQ